MYECVEFYKYKFINKYKFGTHYHDYVKWFNIDLCMHVEIDGDIICKLQSWVVIKDILSSQMTEWITGISSLTYPWWVIKKLESTLTLANRVDLYVVVRWPKLVFSYPASPLFLRTQCPSNIQLRFFLSVCCNNSYSKTMKSVDPKILGISMHLICTMLGSFLHKLDKETVVGT